MFIGRKWAVNLPPRCRRSVRPGETHCERHTVAHWNGKRQYSALHRDNIYICETTHGHGETGNLGTHQIAHAAHNPSRLPSADYRVPTRLSRKQLSMAGYMGFVIQECHSVAVLSFNLNALCRDREIFSIAGARQYLSC